MSTTLSCQPQQPQLYHSERKRRHILCLHQSRDLVRLKMVDGCPEIDALEWSEPDPLRLGAYLREMEFAILARDLEQMAA